VRRVALAAALAALAATGCGGVDGGARAGGSGPLVWTAPPLEFTPETLPGERILTGQLRNEGLRRLRVDLPDLRIRDADGDEVEAQPVFLQTFGKSLWAAGRGPQQVPDTALQRTGRIALLTPGEEVPLTIAWHDEDGEPTRIDYGEGSLPIGG
jgi:hypothetical protein